MATIADIVTGAAQRYGVDPQALLGIAQIESGLNPGARNPHSSAGGLFQFIDGTAKQYGLADRFNPEQAADAAARLARDNAASLRSALGRDPTPADLYLAHQQGAGGAAKILANPNAPLSSLVGGEAAGLNAGGGMTAGQFAQSWGDKLLAAMGQPDTGAAVAPPQAGAPAAPAPAAPSIASLFAEPAAAESPDPWGAAFASIAPRQQRQDDGKARAEAEQARRQALFAPV